MTIAHQIPDGMDSKPAESDDVIREERTSAEIESSRLPHREVAGGLLRPLFCHFSQRGSKQHHQLHVCEQILGGSSSKGFSWGNKKENWPVPNGSSSSRSMWKMMVAKIMETVMIMKNSCNSAFFESLMALAKMVMPTKYLDNRRSRAIRTMRTTLKMCNAPAESLTFSTLTCKRRQ